MITAGIDMGSRTVKVVFLEELDGGDTPQLKWGIKGKHIMFPDELDMDEAAEKAFNDGVAAIGISRDQIGRIVSTGAGRKQVKFAHETVTEVSSGARGAVFICPTARTVVDVGAEEGRGLKASVDGKVVDFAGNEKCAAGAGAFAESMARALQMNLKDFGEAALRSNKVIPMNAQCTVFAESEVVSLIHSSIPKEDIAKSVLDAVASRVCAMVRRVGIDGDVILIGGMVHNPGFVASLKLSLELDKLNLPDMPEYISALGAALIAADAPSDPTTEQLERKTS